MENFPPISSFHNLSITKHSNIHIHCQCTTVLPHLTTAQPVLTRTLPTLHFKMQYPITQIIFSLKRNVEIRALKGTVNFQKLPLNFHYLHRQTASSDNCH